MVNLKFFLLFLAIATGVMANKTEEVIFDQYSSPNEMPYIASLRTNGKHFCAGSIISHYHILTAAHCLSRKMYPHSFVKGQSYVVTGMTMRNFNGTSHSLKHYKLHPFFTTHLVYEYKYDIAILTVNNKIEMNEYQKIIRLPVSPVSAGSIGISSGWNDVYLRSTPERKVSHVLFKIKATIMNFDECYTYQPRGIDSRAVMCSLYESGYYNNYCQGDSGGPFVVGNTLVGVTKSLGCSSGHSETITSVYFFKGWIEQTLNRTGVPRVTEVIPESDFYDEDKVEKLSLKYLRFAESAPDASNVAFHTCKNQEWYVAVY